MPTARVGLTEFAARFPAVQLAPHKAMQAGVNERGKSMKGPAHA